MNEIVNKLWSNYDFTIKFYPEQRKKTIKSYEKLREFYLNEKNYWEPYSQGYMNQIRSHFAAISNQFSVIESNPNNEQFIQRSLSNIANYIQNTKYPLIYSNTSSAKFLTKMYDISHESASMAIDYLFNNKIASISSRNQFLGLANAYEFEVEKSNQYYDATKIKIDEILNQFDFEHSELINKYYETSTIINNEVSDFKNNIDDWVENNKSSYSEFIEMRTHEVDRLEKLYKEKLRLESPAEYWNKLSTEYNEKGNKWRNWSLIISFVYILLLSGILIKMPSTIFSNDIFDFNNLKITVSFAFVASLGVFLVRLFVKLTLSSYHLATDAKERYQLTHVYLSLINDNAITDNERSLVLQSIFSRSETGLIKGDSTPAFPDSMVSGVFNNFKK